MAQLKVQYINEHGEKMIVKKCDKEKLWFHHSDCNNDFELIQDCIYEGNFKYILDETERIILNNFLNNNK